MTLTEHLYQFYNKEKKRKREIGKYWASDIYGIRKGYTNPTNFFKQREVDRQGTMNIFWGQAAECQLHEIFKEQKIDFITQERFELKIADFALSGKTDFSFSDFVLETKCPMEATYQIPEKWKDQLEVQYRATNKPVQLGIFYKNGLKLVRFFPYEPSDTRWEEIQQILKDFHVKLIKKHGALKLL